MLRNPGGSGSVSLRNDRENRSFRKVVYIFHIPPAKWCICDIYHLRQHRENGAISVYILYESWLLGVFHIYTTLKPRSSEVCSAYAPRLRLGAYALQTSDDLDSRVVYIRGIHCVTMIYILHIQYHTNVESVRIVLDTPVLVRRKMSTSVEMIRTTSTVHTVTITAHNSRDNVSPMNINTSNHEYKQVKST